MICHMRSIWENLEVPKNFITSRLGLDFVNNIIGILYCLGAIYGDTKINALIPKL